MKLTHCLITIIVQTNPKSKLKFNELFRIVNPASNPPSIQLDNKISNLVPNTPRLSKTNAKETYSVHKNKLH
jgi:hypothetical protein